MKTSRICVLLVALGGCKRTSPDAPPAAAPPAPATKQRALPVALAPFAALLEPIWKESGAARLKRACASVDQLTAAHKALPDKPPSGAPIDDVAWSNARGEVGYPLDDLGQHCKASPPAAEDDDVVELHDRFAALVVMAAPPPMPPAVQKFDAQLRQTLAHELGGGQPIEKQWCSSGKALHKLRQAISPEPPAGVDATAWKDAWDAIEHNVDEMRAACKPDWEEPGDESGLPLVRKQFFHALALLPVG
jgi:hypothetical protein